MNLTHQFRIYEGQPFFKNSHLAHSILTYQNQEIIVCTNQSIFIFSLSQMVNAQASLMNMISLQKIFPQKAQYCMDPITSIFNKSQKQKLGQKLFLDQNDVSTNILMKGSFLKQRLIYLNDIRLKSVGISSNGDLSLLLCDGRALLIKRIQNAKHLKNYQIIDLNKRVKQKIKSLSFADNTISTLIIHTYQKILVCDFHKDCQKALTKIPIDLKRCLNIRSFCTSPNQYGQYDKNNIQQQLIIIAQFSNKIQFFQVIKKNLTLLDQITCHEYIENLFIYAKLRALFYSNVSGIYKVSIPQLKQQKPVLKMQRSKSKDQRKQKQKVQFVVQNTYSFKTPGQALFIDQSGNFILKQNIANKQYISAICQTQNGFYLALTSKRNGNYKQGRIIIGSLSHKHFVQKLCLNIRNSPKSQYINCQDIKLLTEAKEKKQITNLVSALYKQYNNIKRQEQKVKSSIDNNSLNLKTQQFQRSLQKQDRISVFDTSLSPDQFQVLAINIGYIFEAKQSSKQKLIEKRLKAHFLQRKLNGQAQMQIQTRQNKQQLPNNYQNLQNLCMLSHQKIGQQQLFQCKCCSVFAMVRQDNKPKDQNNMKCYICFGKMSPLT